MNSGRRELVILKESTLIYYSFQIRAKYLLKNVLRPKKTSDISTFQTQMCKRNYINGITAGLPKLSSTTDLQRATM